MLTFHILDAFAHDEVLQYQTGDEKLVAYESEGAVTDDEYEDTRKKKSVVSTDLDKKCLVIHLFGVTAEGKPVRANVYGFQPYFYLRLPSKAAKLDFKKRFAEALGRRQVPADQVEMVFCDKKLLYGYTGGKTFPFVMVKVKSKASWQKVKQIVLKYETAEPAFCLTAQGKPLEVYDANLDPMLRFFHERDIQPCGWVSVSDCELQSNDQIDCQWNEVSPTKGPVPCAPFLLAIWDIE